MAVWFAAPVDAYPHYYLQTYEATSGTNISAAYPVANLFDYDPTKVTRTTAGTTVIVVKVGASTTQPALFDMVSILHSNVSYRATITIEGSNDNSAYTSLVASRPFWANLTGVQSATVTGPTTPTDPRYHSKVRNHSLSVFPTTQSWVYLRFTIADPLVANMTFGRLFVGKRFIPTYGMQYGSAFHFTDYGRSDRTDRGVLSMEPGRNIVSATVKMDFLTKTEMYDYVYEFNHFLGSSREFMACLDDVDTARLQKNLLYCTIAEGRTISFDSFNTHSQSWTLESIA
jgi:hypothetical protein